MKPTAKWLLIPPVVALLLVLGPMSMQGGNKTAATGEQAPAIETTVAAVETTRPGRAAPPGPRTPDLWQMTSALAGVLLLGIGGVMLLRRLRNGAPARSGGTLVTLRQTLRLSARHAVHAIEFDDRILLVGQHERGLALLDSGKAGVRLTDEAEVLARRTAAELEHDDAGAVPKNLIIPRPDPMPQRRLNKPPAIRDTGSPGLNDFRALLQKVGRS